MSAEPVPVAAPVPLPYDYTPAARLQQHGAAALSNAELLGLLGASAVAETPLRDLAGASVLEHRRSLGPKAAARLAAALELGARLATLGPEARPAFRAPDDTARYLLPRYSARPVEVFGLLCLDVRHRLRHEVVISVGCLTSSLVHPREVFREAILAKSAAVVIFHNHPSGDPEPSAEDIALTRRLAAAGQLIGIELLDHVVLGAGRFVSLKSRGVL